VQISLLLAPVILVVGGALVPFSELRVPPFAQASIDSTAVAGVGERFHHALAKGDSAAALELLARDAVIIESGTVESLKEYRSHHLPADIAFARVVKGRRSPVDVTIRGDVAWIVATSTTRGTFRGEAVNSAGAELMVLTRGMDGWSISAIHWSSRAGSR
jgi:ketosteroid isomerase-like protein